MRRQHIASPFLCCSFLGAGPLLGKELWLPNANGDWVGKCFILEANLLIEETLNNISFFSKNIFCIPICLTL